MRFLYLILFFSIIISFSYSLHHNGPIKKSTIRKSKSNKQVSSKKKIKRETGESFEPRLNKRDKFFQPKRSGLGVFSSLLRKLTDRTSSIIRQSLYEQEVEDVNSVHRIDNSLERRLIVMPLTDSFKSNSPADVFMKGKIQYGDKCSLPVSIGRLLFEKRYEVPWIFEIKPINNYKNESSFGPRRQKLQDASVLSTEADEILSPYFERGKVKMAFISPLDFRAPENYIFLPRWLMNDLNLKINDAVDISFIRMKPAELVVFQPLSLDWIELMKETKDPKVLLEHEINKYSTLTAGTTIFIKIGGKEYQLYVKETIAEGGVSVKAVRVQDSDVKTDIDREILDRLLEIQKESIDSKEVVDEEEAKEQVNKSENEGSGED